jgi:hypothetical protein
MSRKYNTTPTFLSENHAEVYLLEDFYTEEELSYIQSISYDEQMEKEMINKGKFNLPYKDSSAYALIDFLYDGKHCGINSHRLSFTHSGESYPIHHDKNKALSCIIYIGESGNGTIFYDRNRENPIEIPWKHNCGYYFYPSMDHPHAYSNKSSEMRTVSLINVWKSG